MGLPSVEFTRCRLHKAIKNAQGFRKAGPGGVHCEMNAACSAMTLLNPLLSFLQLASLFPHPHSVRLVSCTVRWRFPKIRRNVTWNSALCSRTALRCRFKSPTFFLAKLLWLWEFATSRYMLKFSRIIYPPNKLWVISRFPDRNTSSLFIESRIFSAIALRTFLCLSVSPPFVNLRSNFYDSVTINLLEKRIINFASHLACFHRRLHAILPALQILYRYETLLYHLQRSQGFGRHLPQCSGWMSLQRIWNLRFPPHRMPLNGFTHSTIKSWGAFYPKFAFRFHYTSFLFPFLFSLYLGFRCAIHSSFRILCLEFRRFGFYDYNPRAFFVTLSQSNSHIL